MNDLFIIYLEISVRSEATHLNAAHDWSNCEYYYYYYYYVGIIIFHLEFVGWILLIGGRDILTLLWRLCPQSANQIDYDLINSISITWEGGGGIVRCQWP